MTPGLAVIRTKSVASTLLYFKKAICLPREILMFLLHYVIELMFLELDVWFIPPLIVLVPQDSNVTLHARLLTALRVVYAIVRRS